MIRRWFELMMQHQEDLARLKSLLERGKTSVNGHEIWLEDMASQYADMLQGDHHLLLDKASDRDDPEARSRCDLDRFEKRTSLLLQPRDRCIGLVDACGKLGAHHFHLREIIGEADSS